jgi:hypothetical protein
MATTLLSDVTAFQAAEAVSASILQNDIGVAKAAGLSFAALQTALDGAHRGHHGRVAAAAKSNNMAAPAHRDALIELDCKLPKENFSRSDATTMTLVGGRYIVTVAGTFGGSGLVTMVNAGGEVFASFAANGTATVDLKYGLYSFGITDTTGLTATVKNGTY